MKKDKKGQSTLEYVIIIGILIGLFILVGRILQPKVHDAYNYLKSGVSS